jgi:hypothetical protein
MPRLRRIEQLEEEQCRRALEGLDRYLEGRSIEDVEFFCVHGFLPEVPIPSSPFVPEPLRWKERWKQWKKQERQFTNRTVEEREFFCVHGYWPDRGNGGNHGKP